MGRITDVDELAGPLLLLASDAKSYITGQILILDGVYSASIGGSRFTESIYNGLQEIIPDDHAVHIVPSK